MERKPPLEWTPILIESEIFNSLDPIMKNKVNFEHKSHLKSARYLNKILGYEEPSDKFA